MEVTWLFEVAGNNWSTKDITWSSTDYVAKVYPSSFSGVTMRWDISGNSLIAPNDVSFEVDGMGHALEGEYVTIRLVVDGTEKRTWVFKVKSAVEFYGKTQCKCVDFLQDYLEGSWPNTPHPKEVWPTDDTDEEGLDDSCIPVVLGASPYIPVKCVYVSGYERVYVLGTSGPTYSVSEVHSPHSWANQSTWASGDSDISLDLYTDNGYQLLDPVITLEGVTGTGIWTSGDTYYDMLCNFTRGDTSNYTNPVDWIEYILEDFGIPSTYIDSTNFSDTASALDSSLEFVGGFFQKESREKILANLLQQIDCYLACTDKVRIYQFEAASQETITNVLSESFSPQRITKSSSDSGKIQWPDSKTKPQDKLAGKATVPSHQGGSTDDPSGTTLRCRFLAGQSVNAQKAGILYFQKRLQQRNKVSFSHILTELSTVGLSPGEVITVDDTLYGGTRDLIVTEFTVGRDLQVDITGVELNYLEDWADLSVSSISITDDDSSRWNTVTEDSFQKSLGEIDTATINFNNRNDRDGSAVTDPTIATDGTAVQHTENTDSTVNISFEWSWSGTESDIDGFVVYMRGSTSSTSYDFGTSPSEEMTFYTRPDRRYVVVRNLAADLYYTFGVQAYRVVDPDVDSTGAIESSIIQPSDSTENPYHPKTAAEFSGDILGTVQGKSSSEVIYVNASGNTEKTDGTGVDASNMPYQDGTPIEDLEPNEAGADNTKTRIDNGVITTGTIKDSDGTLVIDFSAPSIKIANIIDLYHSGTHIAEIDPTYGYLRLAATDGQAILTSDNGPVSINSATSSAWVGGDTYIYLDAGIEINCRADLLPDSGFENTLNLGDSTHIWKNIHGTNIYQDGVKVATLNDVDSHLDGNAEDIIPDSDGNHVLGDTYDAWQKVTTYAIASGGTFVKCDNHFVPNSESNAYSLGSSTYHWNNVYCSNVDDTYAANLKDYDCISILECLDTLRDDKGNDKKSHGNVPRLDKRTLPDWLTNKERLYEELETECCGLLSREHFDYLWSKGEFTEWRSTREVFHTLDATIGAITQLKSRVEALEQENDDLKSRIEALEKKI